MVMQTPCLVNASALPTSVAILSADSDGHWLPVTHIESIASGCPLNLTNVRDNGRIIQIWDCVLADGHLLGASKTKRWLIIPTMTSKKKIAADLLSALSGRKPLSIDLYVEALADHEAALKASLNKDADDALLCMLADDGDVAMMLIDWDGSIYRNENALQKLQVMWRHSFDTNVQTLLPLFSTHISQKNLGVAGIKWLPTSLN